MRYNPDHDPDPENWLALDEQERIELVSSYHRRKRVRLPNAVLHAVIHAVVETQVAHGDPYPAKSVLLRLMSEGLDRHEAIHAIGSVLAGQFHAALTEQRPEGDLDAQYREKLKALTAESWRKAYSDE